MFTITNGIILKGQDLTLTKENIVVDDGIIIDIGKDSMEGKIIDVDGAVVCPSCILVIRLLKMKDILYH